MACQGCARRREKIKKFIREKKAQLDALLAKKK